MARKKSSRRKSRLPAKPVDGRKPRVRYLMLLASLAIAVAALVLWWTQRTPIRPVFDGHRAFDDLVRQVEFGPRNPNSDGHRECRDFLVSELEQYADMVSTQTFSWQDRRDTSVVYEGTNIIASFNLEPARRGRLMLAAHWDTRPFADRDPNPDNRDQPILGANDGASGVAVLLEMARIIQENPLDFGVDIILFDMEDLGDEGFREDPENRNPFSIGSQYFVENNPGYRPRFGIVVDMVGKRNLRVPREGYSDAHAGHIVDLVWAAARRAGADAFVDHVGRPVYDDHVPFLEQGIPVINIIDFDYPHWHTLDDTPDKCSPESLQQVGDAIVEVLYGL